MHSGLITGIGQTGHQPGHLEAMDEVEVHPDANHPWSFTLSNNLEFISDFTHLKFKFLVQVVTQIKNKTCRPS